MTELIIKRSGEKRIQSGHLWIFSNELLELPKANFTPLVKVFGNNNKFYGYGLYNPHSLIAVRLLKTETEPDLNFFINRISNALEWRKLYFPNENSYRLIFGESDLLPGLIIDKYEDYIAMQILSAAMNNYKQFIIDALLNVLPNTKGIIEKGISHLRKIEGLPEIEEIIYGDIPDEITITENGLKLNLSLLEGQKTGYFLDQKLNRKWIRNISNNKRVLDCFCNQGSFALNASAAGAIYSLGVDISETAINASKENAKLNQLTNCDFVSTDVFDFLENEIKNNANWDLIVLDPPAFAKNKKSIPTAIAGYSRINRLALKILKSGQYLVSSSCSHHIDEETFLSLIFKEASKQSKNLILVHRASQSPDHPVLLSMPETSYLKFFVFRII